MHRLVKWRELVEEFEARFPWTVQDVLDNNIVATVQYAYMDFEIRPSPWEDDAIEVWGPAIVPANPATTSTRS